MKPPVLPFVRPTLAATLRPILANTSLQRPPPDPKHPILYCDPYPCMHKDPLYSSGLHQTMAMAMTIIIMLTHSSLVKIIKDKRLFWENICIHTKKNTKKGSIGR